MLNGSVRAMPSNEDGSTDVVEKKCRICGENVDRRSFKCAISKCNIYVHIKCFENAAKIFCIERKNWCCKNCKEDLKNSGVCTGSCLNSDLLLLQKENECLLRELDMAKKMLANMEYTISLQKDKLAKNGEVDARVDAADKSFKPLFSEVVAKQKSPVVLVKTSDKNVTNKQVEKDVKSAINPGELDISVKNTRLIRDGLLITCANAKSVDALKSNLAMKVGSSYNISVPKKRLPRLCLFGVKSEVAQDENLEEIIISSNKFICPHRNGIKVVTTLKYKAAFNIVLEAEPSLYKLIKQKGSLMLGWDSYVVKDHFSIVRCFKCSQFGHTIKNCKQSSYICGKCGGPHENTNCSSEVFSCVNCINFNAKNHSDVPTNHHTGDTSCYCFKLQIELVKSNTNYGE